MLIIVIVSEEVQRTSAQNYNKKCMKESSEDLSLKNQAALAGEKYFITLSGQKCSTNMLWIFLKLLSGTVCIGVVD